MLYITTENSNIFKFKNSNILLLKNLYLYFSCILEILPEIIIYGPEN